MIIDVRNSKCSVSYLIYYFSIGIDPPILPIHKAAISSAAIIGIVIAVIVVILLLLDITCYFVNRLGVIAICCNSRSKHLEEEDPKLGR